jgi:antitoxin HigA-1
VKNRRRPTHPGVLLKEEVLKPLGLTITEAAKDLGISRKNLSALLNGKISLSPDMAVRLSKATNTSPESWLGMQARLDLWESENKEIKVIPFPVMQEGVVAIKEG